MWQLQNAVRHYPWGIAHRDPRAPRAAASRPTGRTPSCGWARTPTRRACSPTARPLDKAIAEQPDALLGRARCVERFGARLPFLLKVLAADQPLSLQAHPTNEQAEAGFAAEEAAGVPRDDPTRTFKDPFHKPELLLALTPFEALCGFRPVEESLHCLAKLQVPELKPTIAALARGGLRAAIPQLLALSREAPERAGRARSPRRPPGSWPRTTRSSSTPTAGRRRWPRPTRATRAWSSR